MYRRPFGSTFLLTLLLAAAASCDSSRSSDIMADEQPMADALELRASSGAAFIANEKALPPDSAGADRRLIMVNGERFELRRVQPARQ